MLEKRKKVSEIDKIIQWFDHKGEGENPIKLSEKEEEKWVRISYADTLLRKGFSKKMTVAQLRDKYKNPETGKRISEDTAYRIVRATERVLGEIGIGAKEYAKVVTVEFILRNLRRAEAAGDIKGAQYAINQYMKVMGIGEEESQTIPKNALNRHVVYHVVNPEDVGMERISKQEMDEFYREMVAEEPKRTIDITHTEVNED